MYLNADIWAIVHTGICTCSLGVVKSFLPLYVALPHWTLCGVCIYILHKGSSEGEQHTTAGRTSLLLNCMYKSLCVQWPIYLHSSTHFITIACLYIALNSAPYTSQQREDQCTSVHKFVHCLSMPWAALGNELAQ